MIRHIGLRRSIGIEIIATTAFGTLYAEREGGSSREELTRTVAEIRSASEVSVRPTPRELPQCVVSSRRVASLQCPLRVAETAIQNSWQTVSSRHEADIGDSSGQVGSRPGPAVRHWANGGPDSNVVAVTRHRLLVPVHA